MTDEYCAEGTRCAALQERNALRAELAAANTRCAELEALVAEKNHALEKGATYHDQVCAYSWENVRLRATLDRVTALADEWDGEGIHSDEPLMALCDHEARAVIARLRAALTPEGKPLDRWLTVRAENVIGNERKTPCEQTPPTSESVSTLPTTASGATEASTIPANTSQRRCKTNNRCSCGLGDACSECYRAAGVGTKDGDDDRG